MAAAMMWNMLLSPSPTDFFQQLSHEDGICNPRCHRIKLSLLLRYRGCLGYPDDDLWDS